MAVPIHSPPVGNIGNSGAMSKGEKPRASGAPQQPASQRRAAISDDLGAWQEAARAVAGAMYGRQGQDAQAATGVLGKSAEAIAHALRHREAWAHADLQGPPAADADIASPVIEARRLLELIAALFNPEPGCFGSPAYVGKLVKRAGRKHPFRPLSAGKMRRHTAAHRVYELMALQTIKNDKAPKQEAAILQVMTEMGLPRSKIMQGLAECREGMSDPFGPGPHLPPAEAKAEAHRYLLAFAMHSAALGSDSPPEKQD